MDFPRLPWPVYKAVVVFLDNPALALWKGPSDALLSRPVQRRWHLLPFSKQFAEYRIPCWSHAQIAPGRVHTSRVGEMSRWVLEPEKQLFLDTSQKTPLELWCLSWRREMVALVRDLRFVEKPSQFQKATVVIEFNDKMGDLHGRIIQQLRRIHPLSRCSGLALDSSLRYVIVIN